MSQIPEYARGYQDAIRAAITWLHARAKTMNDPRATAVLDHAADELGWARKLGTGGIASPEMAAQRSRPADPLSACRVAPNSAQTGGPPDPLPERERCAQIAERLECPHIAQAIRGEDTQ